MSDRTCESCGAPVVWLLTASGSRMICDDPDRDGKARTFDKPGTRVMTMAGLVRVVEEDGLFTKIDGWAPHWGSCPQAKEWRGKKR
jgi:hypothetical protein